MTNFSARGVRHISLMQLCTVIATVGMALSIAGCDSNALTRVIVTGTVKLRDLPVEDGQIRFIPQAGTAGPVAIAPIRQGKYSCDLQGGVPIGQHRVEILAWDPKAPRPRGPGETPRPQWVPEEYNTKSTLTVSVDGSDGLSVHDFNL